VENESRSIGIVFINQGLWNQMRSAPIVHLEVPFEKRIEHLVDVYAQTKKEDLLISFEKITKKLGFEHTNKAMEAVKNGDYPTAATIALTYYDKAYIYSFDNNTSQPKHILNIPDFDFKKTAEKLVEWASTEGV
jgi:tRNA 2-selenouridine synthase